MKGFYTILSFILLFYIILFPLTAIKGETEGETKQNTSFLQKSETSAKDDFKVKFSKTGKIESVSAEEYVVGVVAAEMAASSETEALKAQAVAAYTFATKRREESKEKYDITDSSDTDQKYIDKSTRKEKWGDKSEEYEKKVKSAVQSVLGEVVTYNGKPILAVYHAISSGRTESAKNVWGETYSYLKSVESVGDLLSPDYLEEKSFSTDEFFQKVKSLGVEKSETPENCLGEVSQTESGTVLKISVNGKTVSGFDLRKAFSLRSASFDLEYKDGKFVFTTRGYGHLVGLSQNGADYMAKQGSSYKEILLWYYSGCKIQKSEV